MTRKESPSVRWYETALLSVAATGSVQPWGHRDTPSRGDLQQLVPAGPHWMFSFFFFLVEQRSLDSWSTASLYLCFAPWISGNHWKPLMHCFFSTRTMIVTVSEQTRRLRSDSQVILGRYQRESLMLWRKLGDFDRQILTRTKSPADRGVPVMGQWWNVLFCFNRI